MSKRARLVAILGVLALLGAGCGGSQAAAQGAGTASATEGEARAVTIVAKDYEYTEAPEELAAGVVQLTFDNQGTVDHEVALVEMGDTPLDQFLQEFPPVFGGAPFPEYAQNIAVPIELPGGESSQVTFTVAEGTYALFCSLDGGPAASASGSPDAAVSEGAEGAEPPPSGSLHYTLGMAQTLAVGPGEAAAALPVTDGSITAADYGFEVDVEAGDKAITFLNGGPAEVHSAIVSIFPEGTDAAAAAQMVTTLLQLPEGQPPPESVAFPEDIAFSGVFSAGLGGTFEVPDGGFQSGRTYAVLCFIQDRAGGPPHAIAYNMFKTFTVE